MHIVHHPRPWLLCLDYDSTLTIKSTLPFIASIATYPKLHPEFEYLSQSYMTDLRKHDANYPEPASQRLDLSSEYRYLESLKDIEEESLRRIEKAQIFNDVSAFGIEHVAELALARADVSLRPGWNKIFDQLTWLECHVISVAWSAHFIQKTIAPSLDAVQKANLHIHANEIQASGNITGSQLDDGKMILTASDKMSVMRDVAAKRQSKHATSADPLVIYVGDSATDLMCLVEADVGICMQDNPLSSEQKQLQRTLERLGIPTELLKNHNTVAEDRAQKVIWISNDLNDIKCISKFGESDT